MFKNEFNIPTGIIGLIYNCLNCLEYGQIATRVPASVCGNKPQPEYLCHIIWVGFLPWQKSIFARTVEKTEKMVKTGKNYSTITCT